MGVFQLNTMTLGRFIPGDSPVHHLDPRTKMIAVMVLMGAMLSMQNMILTGLYLLFAVMAYRLAHFNLKILWQTARPLLILIVLTWLIHAFFDPRTPRWICTPLGIGISWPGCLSGLLFSTRLLTLVLIAGLLTLTTAPMSIAEGLYRLIRPLERLGLPAQDVAMMISIALRFIPILMEEAQRIYKAQLARGVHFNGRGVKRAKMILPILIPLFLSTFRRANDLAIAMEARCYQSGHLRTSLYTLQYKRLDWSVMAGLTLFLLPVALWR